MSWIREEELKLSWLESLAVNVIKQGPIPNHIAIIMDGNRRYSVKTNIEKVEGHKMGFEKLSEALQWCLELNIKEVTVYAFSIENFKRSKEEVDALLTLAKEKFVKLLEEKQKLMERGIRIRVIGNFKMLPKDLQKLIADVMLMTCENDKSVLNVAFAYTSRDEITNSLKTIVQGVENDELKVDDLSDSLIDECLYTSNCSDVDLILRTSGEKRFSDFLLWQTQSTVFYFTEALWPEFTLWNLLGAIFYYQRSSFQTSLIKNHLESSKISFHKNERVHKFLKTLEVRRTEELRQMQKLIVESD